MDTAKEKLDVVHKQILAAMDRHPLLTFRDSLLHWEKQSGWSRAWLLCSVASFLTMAVWVLGGVPFIAKLVAFVYPAYASFKTIDTPSSHESETWLTYWIVFAAVGIVEPIAWPLLNVIPLYQFVKMGFLVWCYNPRTRGASTIYRQVLRPYVLPAIGVVGGGGGGAATKSTTTSRSAAAAAAAASVAKPDDADAQAADTMPLFASEFIYTYGVITTTTSRSAASASVVEPDDADAQAAAAEQEVSVRVLSAAGLPLMEAGATDAYVLLYVMGADGKTVSDKCKTKTKPNSTEPRWGEELSLRVRASDVAPGACVVAIVCHKTGFGQDLTIGTVQVPLTSLAGGEEMQGDFALEDKAKDNPVGVSGKLSLALRLQ
ncbi:TB2/DP1, HVA22 family-domain-containing protein [Tribonema minus]|uniref:TB2/DP1, HVA22 family-domain-containing protein n=1 Tax=Tribonema minus TaxID=303371 RepID=A0A836CPN9_9STRA|nr:TB2/DP1, HVA22 family-domain-containing protein [Tribonema minus]